jgi:C1A family cysteine protease
MYSAFRQVERPGARDTIGTGWIPPLPDLRDYTIDHPEIAKMAKKLGYSPKIATVVKKLASSPPRKDVKLYMGNPLILPSKKDLRKYCSPIENQGGLGSCTAQAAVGMVEYFERRAFKKHIDGSRLFVYKTTRNLIGVTGDTGAWNRNAMGALVLCGCPPEKYWPYTDSDPEFDEEPPTFVYAVADNFEALKYFCHDPQAASRPTSLVLFLVKLYLAMGIPSVFGFYGFEYGHYEGGTYVMPYDNGEIPYPCPGDYALWGHAVVAVGYDDKKVIKNDKCNKKTTGALLIRNSWGTGWGNDGYGWIPYDFVIDKMALDFWSLLSMEWVDTKKFGL